MILHVALIVRERVLVREVLCVVARQDGPVSVCLCACCQVANVEAGCKVVSQDLPVAVLQKAPKILNRASVGERGPAKGARAWYLIVFELARLVDIPEQERVDGFHLRGDGYTNIPRCPCSKLSTFSNPSALTQSVGIEIHFYVKLR
jgi:hypothetical protein